MELQDEKNKVWSEASKRTEEQLQSLVEESKLKQNTIDVLETDKETTQYDNLSLIEKETKRCKIIIENLLKFSRQEKVAFDRVEINRVVEDAIAIVNHQMGINQVKLYQELTAELPPIWGNANQIQQVLLNLMINAQQAMEGQPGGVTLTTTQLNSGHIQIQIIDDGPGISHELQTKIFEPFFTTKPSGEGTGLGLSVSYGIVKEHKGEINVKSKPGDGTTFTIILPVAALANVKSPSIGQ